MIWLSFKSGLYLKRLFKTAVAGHLGPTMNEKWNKTFFKMTQIKIELKAYICLRKNLNNNNDNTNVNCSRTCRARVPQQI